MPSLRRNLKFMLPALMFTAAAACDLFLQKFEVPSEWHSLALTLRALRFGLFFGAAAFVFGKLARFMFIPFWCWFCCVLAIEAVAHFNFGMVLDGDWVMILAASSSEELGAFSKQFSPAACTAAALALPLTAGGGSWLLLRLP